MRDVVIRAWREQDLLPVMNLLSELSQVAEGFDVTRERASEHFQTMQSRPDV